ncbi:hypothetical protein Fmac_022014 [Flemingia macrophylla]|uniref:MOM1 alpha-helical domain-containing protein n=1 Tax=Flemingia macrophylla TaxID=520843 RepID=A0ABD1LYH3_9FABA
MPNNAGSDNGPVTRSSAAFTPNRKSERLEKRTPPQSVRADQKTRSPLRRSERGRNGSSSASLNPSKSLGSRTLLKRHCTGKRLAYDDENEEEDDENEDEERYVEASSRLGSRRTNARLYRAFFGRSKRGCREKTYVVDRSSQEGGFGGESKIDGYKIDDYLKGNCLDSAKDDKDILPPKDATRKEMRVEPKSSGPVKEVSENEITVYSLALSNAATSIPSEATVTVQLFNAVTCEPSGATERVQLSNAASCEPSGATERVRSSNAASCETEAVQSGFYKEETSQMSGSRGSTANENFIRKCLEHHKGEKPLSSKRKITMVDMHSDASAMLVNNDNNNLSEEDAPSLTICSNVVETSGSCSKRIRRISLSDVKRDWRKSTDNVDQPSSNSNAEKLSTRSKEAITSKEALEIICFIPPLPPPSLAASLSRGTRLLSQSSVSERPQGSTVETEKIRKQQRSLHLLLKPEIANLCEILCLPDNVKRMVENCLEYTMYNYQICTEPVSILQAFQLSLCWTAASLLNHKLDFEASLMLAKQRLNFDCQKEVVDEINSRLWGLKENFLLLTENSNFAGYPKASIEVTPEDELVKNDNSKNIKNIKSQWNKLLLMQQEEKQKLKKDIENEKLEFWRRYQIERAAIRSCFPNDVMREEKLRVFDSEYLKRIKELDRQHEIRLKDLEAKQLKTKLMFRESSAPDELLNLVALNQLGNRVDSLQTSGQAQHHNAPDRVAEGKGFNDIVEVMTKTGTGIGFPEAPDTSASVIVPCSSPVETQTSLVKHAEVNEMDIVASEDRPVSGNKCNYAENEYDSQGNIISKHSKAREQCFDGAISMPDKGQGCVNFSCESLNGFAQDAVTQVPPSSNKEICNGETLDVPSGEVAPKVCNSSNSNNDHVEIPSSRPGELDGTVPSIPVCGPSVEVEANGSSDGANNMLPLNSQSFEEDILNVHTMCTPNCENSAQVHNADDNYGSNNPEPLKSPFSDERISPWNSKSPQDHVRNENVMSTLSCENFAQILEDDGGNGSNNVILNSPLIDERNADGTTLLNRDSNVGMLETAYCSPSRDKIFVVALDVSVLDSMLSRPHGSVSPGISSDANAFLSNQPSLQKQNPDSVSSSIPTGQIPVEVSETTHERATVSVFNWEEAVGIPGTVNCTDYPHNVTPSSSCMGQISNGGPVFDGDLSSGPCTTSASNGWTLHGEQIPVLVPENSHEEAECQLTDSVMVDKSTTSNQQEGLRNTMTENSLSLETPVSRPGDLMEPVEQVQPLSSVEYTPDKDTAREMQNSLVSCTVDIVPANQSTNDSLVIELPGQEGQLPSVGFLSSTQDLSNLPLVTETEDQPSNVGDISNHIPETSIEIQNEAVVQHPSIHDQQEGVCRTVTENSSSQQTPVTRLVDLLEPLEQMHLSSVGSPPDRNPAREKQNTLVSNPVDIVPVNQSTNDSLVMEPPDKEVQSNFTLMTGTEDQLSNEDDLPNHIPETSIEIQNQAVVQRASNLELDSCSRQAVHPASHVDLDSLIPGEVRLQSSDPRNYSTLAEINNHPIQPASQSASRIIPNLCRDPLKNELERLRRLSEQNMRDYENKVSFWFMIGMLILVLGFLPFFSVMVTTNTTLFYWLEQKVQLKNDFEKELEELCRKYDNKRKEIELELQKVRKNLDAQFNIVLVNKILAEAFRAKSMDLKVSAASGFQQDASFGQQLFHLLSQQNATRPSLVPSPSGPRAGSLQSSFATTTSQTMVPPIQATHNSTPGTFTAVSSRLPPPINSLSSPLGSVQPVGEIRAPAPHLQPYRPSTSTSAPAPNSCTTAPGRPSQPAPGNVPATSSIPLWTPRAMPATFQSVPLRGHWPGSTGGLPTPNLSAMNSRADANSQPGKNLPNVRPQMSDLASLNLSKFGTGSSIMPANSAHQAMPHDVVCLSDDE